MSALTVTQNERIVMGGNRSPFDEHNEAIGDLWTEAEAWLNGDGIKSEADAEGVEKLLDLSRKAKKAADEARAEAKRPHDEAGKAVQAQWTPIIRRADTIADACKEVLAPWRAKIKAEKDAIAEAARRDAEDIRRKAQEAMQASAGNVLARQDAEHLLNSAKIAEKDAAKATKAAATGNGLRTTPKAVLVDGAKAAEHYWRTRRDDFRAFLQKLADSDARSGTHSIPGFEIVEEKTAI